MQFTRCKPSSSPSPGRVPGFPRLAPQPGLPVALLLRAPEGMNLRHHRVRVPEALIHAIDQHVLERDLDEGDTKSKQHEMRVHKYLLVMMGMSAVQQTLNDWLVAMT